MTVGREAAATGGHSGALQKRLWSETTAAKLLKGGAPSTAMIMVRGIIVCMGTTIALLTNNKKYTVLHCSLGVRLLKCVC